MRILIITQENSGVGYHRLMLPVYFLEKTYAYFTDVLNDEALKEGFDLVILNRFAPGTPLEKLLEYREKYGFKLVVDIDDYWYLDTGHILYSVYPTIDIINHIKEADLVTCTNDELWNQIRPINSNVVILPNALPYGEDQFTDVRIKFDKVKFVYTGSITHENDIKILQFPLKRVAGDSNLKSKVFFELCGYNDEGAGSAAIWHRMISNFTCGLKLGGTRRYLPVTEYMNFYNDADCSLVPLVNTKFNRMKSNLKLLEAACKKIPVIGSNVPPYSGSPMIEVNSQGDWYKEIKKVTEDSIYREEKGLILHEWAKENFNLFKVNQLRKQVYAGLKM